jgi:hypothetical protein
VDWNDDGLDDFLLGDMDGYVNFFQREGEGISDLMAPVHIQAMGVDINVESMAGPACVCTSHDGTRTRLDWNEDGLGDLVVGSWSLIGSPTLRLYLNSGSNEYPVFDSVSFVMAGGTEIYVSRMNPHIVDLDGDGRKDIIAGNHAGGIIFFQNIGTNSNPVFDNVSTLYSCGQPIDIDTGSKVWPEDMNGDGILDLLASDYSGMVYVFPGVTGSSAGEAEEETDQLMMRVAGSPAYDGHIDILLTVPSAQQFSIRVFDSSGRIRYRTVTGHLDTGEHRMTIEQRDLPSGLYFVTATGETGSCCLKVTLID